MQRAEGWRGQVIMSRVPISTPSPAKLYIVLHLSKVWPFCFLSPLNSERNVQATVVSPNWFHYVQMEAHSCSTLQVTQVMVI